MEISMQVLWLFVLALPIACISWTVTHEEIFREPRDYWIHLSVTSKTLVARKFFYLFTCEYCFSHYVVIFFLFITHYKLLVDDWRGYLIAFFALVWITNVYMSLYSKLRISIKDETTQIKLLNKEIEGGIK